MIYNKIDANPRWSDDVLLNSFRAQIDNSFKRGWKKDDIIIGKITGLGLKRSGSPIAKRSIIRWRNKEK